MEQTPECVLGQTESADVDGVLGDRVELRCVAAKPTLMRQRMGNVLDQDFLWVWVQRPKLQAGESANEAVETTHTVSGTRLTAPHNFLGESGALQHRREHRRWRGGNWPSQFSQPQAGKDHGAKRSGPRPGNKVFALLDRTGTGQYLVAVTGTALSTTGVFCFARPAPAPPSIRAGTGPWRFWSSPRPPSFHHAPPSKERNPSVPACSPPAEPQAPSAFAFRRRSVRSRRTRSAKASRSTPR